VGLQIPEDRTEDRAKLADILARIRAQIPPKGADLRSYRILLVEDNPHIMEMYEYVMRKLSKSGEATLEVTLAKDGHDAMEKLAKETFDLVVTDLFMPVLDGFELIRKMRADPRSKAIPVVAISAGGADAAVQAHSVGADVYLRKPVRFVDVIETVRVLLKL
jgi:CheY-like chemotaxis protein